MDQAKLEAYAHRTISSRAFHFIVSNRLKAKQPLSVVRMADGERQLFVDCQKAILAGHGKEPIKSFDHTWRTRLGVEGISSSDLYVNMQTAILTAEYFCPSTSAYVNSVYNMYDWMELAAPGRNKLVDNFWTDSWTNAQRQSLIELAGSVLIVHRNPVVGSTLQRRAKQFLKGVTGHYVPMSSWDQARPAMEQASEMKARLVLVSAGPASKWIIPQLAKFGGDRVVLDVGHGVDHWLCAWLDSAVKGKG